MTWQVPPLILPTATVIDQMAGKLVRSTEKRIRRRADADTLFRSPLGEIPAFGDRKHEGLFRVDMLAGIDHLARHLIVNRRDGEIDHQINVRRAQQSFHGFGADAELLGASRGRFGIDVSAGADLDALEQRRKAEIGGGDIAASDDADTHCASHDHYSPLPCSQAIERLAKRVASDGLSCSMT